MNNNKLKVNKILYIFLCFLIIISIYTKVFPIITNFLYKKEINQSINNFYKFKNNSISLIRLSDTNYNYVKDFQLLKIKNNNVLLLGQEGNEIFFTNNYSFDKFDNNIKIIDSNFFSYNTAIYTETGSIIYVSFDGIYKYDLLSKRIFPIIKLDKKDMYVSGINKYNLQILKNDQVLITGLGINDCYIFDNKSNQLEKIQSMNHKRIGYKSILLDNGNVIFIGGQDKILEKNIKREVKSNVSDTNYVHNFEIFDLKSKTFKLYKQEKDIVNSFLFFVDDFQILIIQPIVNKIYLYNYKANHISKIFNVNRKIHFSDSFVKLNDKKILIIGCEEFVNEENNLKSYYSKFKPIIYSVDKKELENIENFTKRDFINTICIQLEENKVLVIGGKMQNRRADLLLYK